MAKRNLFERLMHPTATLFNVLNYHREPAVRKSIQKAQKWGHDRNRSYFDPCFCSSYNANRIELYRAYEEILRDPLTDSVLDTYAQSCTQSNSESSGQHAGRVVWCFSGNPEVQKIVTQFLDRIQVDLESTTIVRSMLAYGDHYEAIPGVPNEGIVGMIPYDPWEIANIWDGQNRVSSYGRASELGEIVNMDDTIPFYGFMHFKMRSKRRTQSYGAPSSLLNNTREYFQDIQWIEDKIIIDRLQRRQSRLGILLDVGGMSGEDAWVYCEEVRRRLYRDQYFDPQNNQLNTVPSIWSDFKDILLPTGENNNTQITTIPETGSNSNLEDLNYFQKKFFGALKFPAGYLGLDIGDSYDRSQPLEKQDVAFAQNCMGPQKAFLSTLTMGALIDLAYRGIDGRLDSNAFSLMMVPVSAYQEMERKDLINMRYDLLERALQLGDDRQWDMAFWSRYVMREYGQMSDDLIDNLLKNQDVLDGDEETIDQLPPDQVDGSSFGTGSEMTYESAKQRDKLREVLGDNPEMTAALKFFYNGGGMCRSSQVHYPANTGNLNLEERLEVKIDKNSTFQEQLKKKLNEKAENRINFWQQSLVESM